MKEEKGVSVIVGEVLLVGIIVAVLSLMAMQIIGSSAPQARTLDLEIIVENAEPTPADNLRVIIYHLGGDALGIPEKDGDEFGVIIGHFGANSWENEVAWNSWTFSEPEDGFEIGENAVGYVSYVGANANIGDTVWVTVVDYKADKIIYHDTTTIQSG